MNKLPEGVAVILVYLEGTKLRKTLKLTKYESIINGYRLIKASNRKCRIYPINSKNSKNLSEIVLTFIWKEAMTLPEFEEYLND